MCLKGRFLGLNGTFVAGHVHPNHLKTKCTEPKTWVWRLCNEKWQSTHRDVTMSKQRHFTFKYPIGCHRLSCRTGSSETDPGRKQKSVVLTSFWHPGRSSYPDSPRIWSIHGCVHRATGRGLCVQLGTSHAAQILLMDPINPSKNEMLDACT